MTAAAVDYKVKLIALLGKDVSNSPSPAMHNAAFRHMNLPYSYSAVSISENEFEREFHSLLARGYAGFNITIPFKEKVFRYLDRVEGAGEKLEAVNTVIFREGKIIGENTDVHGFARALGEAGHGEQNGGAAFVFGAGGACRAAIEALFSMGMRRFTVAGRGDERLNQLEKWFEKNYSEGSALETFSFPSEEVFRRKLSDSTLFVNAAPLAACKEIPFFTEIQFPADMVCVDWVYLPKTTPWLMKARKSVHGYKILLYQGTEAFRLWTGIEAPEEVMEQALMERVS